MFLGLIGSDDFHIGRHAPGLPASERMRPAAELVMATPDISLQEASTLLWDRRLHVLPVVGADGRLVSLVLRRDYLMHKRFANESVGERKRFLVAAGINSRDHKERVPALVEAGAGLLCLGSSDGFTEWQARTLEFIRDEFGGRVHCGAGNVVDGAGFEYLADAGAAFVKVGIGGGSICITRHQKGIGRGQASALLDVPRARDAEPTNVYVPICRDGGVLNDRDMAVALAMGSDFIMLGRYFARLDESPSRRRSSRGTRGRSTGARAPAGAERGPLRAGAGPRLRGWRRRAGALRGEAARRGRGDGREAEGDDGQLRGADGPRAGRLGGADGGVRRVRRAGRD